MLTSADAFKGVARLAEKSTHFKNEMCARLSLLPHAPDPILRAKTVKCTVQILVCSKDTLVSPKSHIRISEEFGDQLLFLEAIVK